jgi:PAS domain S-box-containing protein
MVAIDQTVESIVFTDIRGTILYVNQGFEKMTGYSRQEVLGRNPRLLKSESHSDAFFKEMWNTITRGEVWHGQFTNRRKDGTLYDEEATISPVRDANGKIISYVAVKRDITRERLLEQQVIEAQKMEAVGQLAGGVAHDYNNILASSIIQLGMLLAEPDLKPDLRAALEMLKKGEDRAAKLTRQLLTFSRRQVMQMKPVELNTVLNDEYKLLHRLLGEHIELRHEPLADEVWIQADPGMIEQVIMNLCINARDAMPKGGQLALGLKVVELADGTNGSVEARPGTFACLTVTDTGCGIRAEILPRIFEPFFTTKDIGKGTGLGLSTAYGIVKQHKGWIEVTSTVGQGSEFRVFLPSGTPAGAPAAGTVPQIARGTETILVVEDEEPLRKSVVKFLKFAGYHVLEAADGPEALRLWSGKIDEINLLLTDMIMPGGMNGRDLAEAFRKLKPALPVILTSGYSDEMTESDFTTKLGFAYLPKPCDPVTLTEVVQKSLDRTHDVKNPDH